MTTSPTPPYRPIAEQVAAVRAGEYAGETEEQRFERYAGAAAVGRGVLEEFAARLGGVDEKEALNELLCCLMVRSWEIDEEAHATRAAGGVHPRPTFRRAVDDAAFRLELAAHADEGSLEAEEPPAPGMSG